eukprot:scaffold163120_cov23-Tisochrysis_lutea.AAC.1
MFKAPPRFFHDHLPTTGRKRRRYEVLTCTLSPPSLGRVNRVSMRPKARALHRMPKGPHSCRGMQPRWCHVVATIKKAAQVRIWWQALAQMVLCHCQEEGLPRCRHDAITNDIGQYLRSSGVGNEALGYGQLYYGGKLKAAFFLEFPMDSL